uniref:NADH-ubiquinone oxidoreductase 21kDa subunit N-terminal domain-containing protein n=1 Tax=Entomoneis paludosa TaxID=265537 RepID=A0A7S3DT70_9STRA|mmetsp:Transcript_35404/g.73728  ORF Transcript_35404/g.73728 Transcript_35404/m.73728 type:complete len:102 (+) Transcript_35404:91-396(+)|eukprot:CAMPEP_0172440076 /NCGR_PEP_ID=MMETSP1065-20121228/851_1 /TAXON_ID=265537 /ORGANISM="Amphiprora paludosa, Strain CCMP125" /LENGTH=101 /DNA_ID=CAMNT_0013188857 /DNA_START=358 /DNA_END=663 /DNA_ORIENTATION=-
MPRELYPMLDDDPSVVGAYSTMRFSDYAFIGGMTSGSWVLGFLRGRPIRHAGAGMMATIGFTFGTFYVLQSCRNRLLGVVPNEPEQKLFPPGTDLRVKYEN